MESTRTDGIAKGAVRERVSESRTFSFPTRVLVCLFRYRSLLLLAPFSLKRTTTSISITRSLVNGLLEFYRNVSVNVVLKRSLKKKIPFYTSFVLQRQRIPWEIIGGVFPFENRECTFRHIERNPLFSGQFRTITRSIMSTANLPRLRVPRLPLFSKLQLDYSIR